MGKFLDATRSVDGQKNKLAALVVLIRRLAEAGKFFWTELLLEPEEGVRTFCRMAIDGVQIDGAHYAPGNPDRVIELPSVRLLSVDGQPIMGKVVERRTVPWTGQEIEEPRIRSFGLDATLPHRQARGLIERKGYPVSEARSQGGRRGTLVEAAWLKYVVDSGAADDATREVYERIKARTAPPPPPSTVAQIAASLADGSFRGVASPPPPAPPRPADMSPGRVIANQAAADEQPPGDMTAADVAAVERHAPARHRPR